MREILKLLFIIQEVDNNWRNKNGYKRIDMEIKTQNNNREGKSKVESLWMNYQI